MHEISVAEAILARALDAAAEHDADRIEALTIEVGRATHVNTDQVVFCLDAITEGTPAEGVEVRTEAVDPFAACDCGWSGAPESLDVGPAFAPDVRCPECGHRAHLERGRECRLVAIEVPDGESTPDKQPAQ
jgi:hydrogenase nickel incorporation protein HypA/HybF